MEILRMNEYCIILLHAYQFELLDEDYYYHYK